MGFPIGPQGPAVGEGNKSYTENKVKGGMGVEEEDRMEREDKVKRRLSAQLIDSSTPTGINTRKMCVCVCACLRACFFVHPRACVYASGLMIYHVNLSKGLSPCWCPKETLTFSTVSCVFVCVCLRTHVSGMLWERERGGGCLTAVFPWDQILCVDSAIPTFRYSGSAVAPQVPAIILGGQHYQWQTLLLLVLPLSFIIAERIPSSTDKPLLVCHTCKLR